MYEVYWGCLVAGIAFGLFSLLFGDGVSDAFDGLTDGLGVDGFDFLHPMTILSAIVVFGGSGVLLSDYTGLSASGVALLSAATGVLFSILSFFVYVRPMRRTESSLGYSVRELVGRTAEVTIPVPASGHGEIEIRIGPQVIYQIASSWDGSDIPSETTVVIVSFDDGVASVTPSDV